MTLSTLRFGATALSLAIDIAGAAAWGLAAFFIAASLVSTLAGGIGAIAVFLSVLSYTLTSRMQEARALSLREDLCPRCNTSTRREHEHRRGDVERETWLSPLTTWQCGACSFEHSEAAPCDHCPEAVS